MRSFAFFDAHPRLGTWTMRCMICGGANCMHKATFHAEDHSSTLIRCIILHTFFGIDYGLCPQGRSETHRGCGSRVQPAGHLATPRLSLLNQSVEEATGCRARDASRQAKQPSPRRRGCALSGAVELLGCLVRWCTGIELRVLRAAQGQTSTANAAGQRGWKCRSRHGGCVVDHFSLHNSRAL
jgi:hypothetical protein